MTANKKKSVNWKYVSLSLVGLIIGVGIGSLLYKLNSDKIKQIEEDSKPIYTVVTDEVEENNFVTSINSVLSSIASQSVAFNVQVGDNIYDCYLYNNTGESIVQSSDGSYTTVFTNNNHSIKSITKDNTVVIDSSVDLLTPCKNAIKALKNNMNDTTLTKVTYANDTTKGVYEYTIRVKGYDSVKSLYSSVGDDFSTSMVDSLQSYIGEDWIPELEFGFIYSTSGELALYCNAIIDEQRYTNWVCEGYVSFVEWELNKQWYSTEFKTDNSQALYDLMQDELTLLNTKMEEQVNQSE